MQYKKVFLPCETTMIVDGEKGDTHETYKGFELATELKKGFDFVEK